MRRIEAPLSRELLTWFDRKKRDLPWRRSRDAYDIWLSEVMLQQTRVETVIPYYERFRARFPTLEDLAAAPLDEVLALWSGLGYYRRARQLHAAAVRMAAAGGPPRSLDGWLALPGIGAYTAAAVASMACGVAAPVLDGNVERVMARRLALAADGKSAASRRLLRAAAAELLDPVRPGDSNQALMEVGATVCLPRRPRCGECPLRRGCRAADEGRPESYPVARARRQAVKVRLLVAVVEAGGRVLLYRRPEESELLAGIWELPWVELADRRPGAARRLAEKYSGGVGAQEPEAAAPWRLGPELARVRHTVTHRDLVVSVRRARLQGDEVAAGSGECGWFGPAELAALPVSSLVGKVLRAAGWDPAPASKPLVAVGEPAGGGAAGEDEPPDDLVVELAQPARRHRAKKS